MQQLELRANNGEARKVYEFTFSEFDLLLSGFSLYGHPGKLALIKSNDLRSRSRPKAPAMLEEIEKLAEVVDDKELIQPPKPTEFDLLREDRKEVKAVIQSAELDAKRRHSHVYLGIYTTGQAFDALRVPYATRAFPDEEVKSVLQMMDQFYGEAVERVGSSL